MIPEHLRFGGGATDSIISPFMAIYLLIAIVLILVLPRRMVIVPFLVAFFTIPIEEVIVAGGLHFTALRILILAVLARRIILPRRDKYPGGVNSIDWFVILWSTCAVIAFFVEFPGMPAVVQGLGTLLDTLGGYLAVRSLIPDGDGVRRTVKTLAVVCAILGLCMLNEQINHVNIFELLGKLPPAIQFKNGHIRSQGTLGSLYAGAFSGVIIPLFIWLWRDRKSRMVVIAGVAGTALMVYTSYASTSWMAVMGGFLGLAFWRFRKKMQLVRWGFVASLIMLQMVMKAPVWALIARIDLTGSSSSYQRYQLVDMTLRHFGEWWLIGTPNYVSWGWDSWDLCNQFAAVALTGGLLTLIFYIAIFKQGFSAVGKAIKRVDGDHDQEWMFWCFGSSLFAVVVAHFGINYMAQLIMGFFPLIACISVVSYESTQAAAETAELPGKKWFEWSPLPVEADAASYEAKPLAQQSSIKASGEKFIPWLKA
jgi:hypothetical protein